MGEQEIPCAGFADGKLILADKLQMILNRHLHFARHGYVLDRSFLRIHTHTHTHTCTCTPPDHPTRNRERGQEREYEPFKPTVNPPF